MKALSLWQAWASLMADRRKTIETRHWKPPVYLIGQNLAIHATMKVDKEFSRSCGYDPITIPRGCIVAVVKLSNFMKFTEQDEWNFNQMEEGKYGDFSTGRFGWECIWLEKLNPPIAAVGHQGIWEWGAPACSRQ